MIPLRHNNQILSTSPKPIRSPILSSPTTQQPILTQSSDRATLNKFSNQPQSQSQSQQQQQPQPQPQLHNHNHGTVPRHMKRSWTSPSFIGANVAIYIFSFLFLYEFIIIARPSFWLPALIVMLILLFMTLWCYYTTSCSSPGISPFYYGLSSQLDQKTPRKYCILCHNFKPQRTHHCSSCSKCILNMDHHCPWVNNCIGFQNKKYFILFLVYITTGLSVALIFQIIVMISQIKKAVDTQNTDIHFVLKCILMIFTLVMTFSLISFTLFHIKMVFRNQTTLQGIIKKKNASQNESIGNYDIGSYQNFQQVFGQNCLYWPFPIKGNGPKGNGTIWPKPNFYRNLSLKDQQRAPIISSS